eukprot:CAMPEP_0115220218 /NCGR_PEP_ID=MMETSP0270-20121206/27332_1 /TAXON_ID=71861 /ORGANISM="Scrippsiella trochoidea, Strain CCMP3099" /LENGTH=37 /DNA_ID= /DNA_START= /DNA_END= /DNA_ORIENTATION=
MVISQAHPSRGPFQSGGELVPLPEADGGLGPERGILS